MMINAELSSLQGFLTTDSRRIPMGIGRGGFLIEPTTKDSIADPSRWLVIPRGMEGLVIPVLNVIKNVLPDSSIAIDKIPVSEGAQAQYVLHSRSILDTGDYLTTLVYAMNKFTLLDSGKLTQEEVVVEVCDHLEKLAEQVTS